MGVIIRMVGQPHGVADGVSLRRYKPGRTYEMEPVLAEYLVLQGYGRFEMRRQQRSSRKRATDRRHPPQRAH